MPEFEEWQMDMRHPIEPEEYVAFFGELTKSITDLRSKLKDGIIHVYGASFGHFIVDEVGSVFTTRPVRPGGSPISFVTTHEPPNSPPLSMELSKYDLEDTTKIYPTSFNGPVNIPQFSVTEPPHKTPLLPFQRHRGDR